MDATTSSPLQHSAPERTSPAPAATDNPDYVPSIEELLKDIPEHAPLPKWDDPKLRYMPKGSGEGQPSVTTEDAWRKLHNLVEKYDKGMCDSYREQIDTLLVFAGLFSAVVTAFAVESYQWLQDDPNDASAELLRQTVVLLSLLANQTSASVPPQQGPALSDSVVVRINLYWFLSLVLSLSAALIGIVCKQWLREYERDIGQSAEKALSVRQMKFEGLDAWHIGAIITSVPLLLQFALGLFLIGISELLWQLHRTVAIAVTTAAGLIVGFYLMTALAPCWQYVYLSISSRMQQPPRRWRASRQPLPGRTFTHPQCPYKSPQAWIVLRLFQPVIDWTLFRHYRSRNVHRPNSWVSFDTYWAARRDDGAAETTTSRALLWTSRTLGETHVNAWSLLCSRDHSIRSDPRRSYRPQHERENGTAQKDLLSRLKNVDDDPSKKTIVYNNVATWSISCHPDLDINTSMELLLHLVAEACFDADCILSGLLFIQQTFGRGQPILNDDLALSLLQLVQGKLGHYSSAALPMLRKAAEILMRAPSRTIFIPALCAVASKFFRLSSSALDGDDTPSIRSAEAFQLLYRLPHHNLASSPDVRNLRGFGHIVSLAQFTLENDPDIPNNMSKRETFDALGLGSLFDEHLRQFHDRLIPSDTPAVPANSQLGPDVAPISVVPPTTNAGIVDETLSLSLQSEITMGMHEAPASESERRYPTHGDDPNRLRLDEGATTTGTTRLAHARSETIIEIHNMVTDPRDASHLTPLLRLNRARSIGNGTLVIGATRPPHTEIGSDIHDPCTSPHGDDGTTGVNLHSEQTTSATLPPDVDTTPICRPHTEMTINTHESAATQSYEDLGPDADDRLMSTRVTDFAPLAL